MPTSKTSPKPKTKVWHREWAAEFYYKRLPNHVRDWIDGRGQDVAVDVDAEDLASLLREAYARGVNDAAKVVAERSTSALAERVRDLVKQ